MRPALILALIIQSSLASAGPQTGVWAEDPAACRGHLQRLRPDLLSLGPGGFERWRETCRFADAPTRAGGWTVETATCRIYEGGDYRVRFSWRLLTDRYLLTAIGSGDIVAWRRCDERSGWGADTDRAPAASPVAAYGFAIGLAGEAARVCPGLAEDPLGTKALLSDAVALGRPGVDDPAAAIEAGAAALRERAASVGDRDAFCRGLIDGYAEGGALTPGLLRPAR